MHLDISLRYEFALNHITARLSIHSRPVNEELKRTIVQFTFPPDSPDLHMLIATANEDQKARYLDPYGRGETVSAIDEPGAGADPAGMMIRAERDSNNWMINGRKI